MGARQSSLKARPVQHSRSGKTEGQRDPRARPRTGWAPLFQALSTNPVAERSRCPRS